LHQQGKLVGKACAAGDIMIINCATVQSNPQPNAGLNSCLAMLNAEAFKRTKFDFGSVARISVPVLCLQVLVESSFASALHQSTDGCLGLA
jgi:hypothetical protein